MKLPLVSFQPLDPGLFPQESSNLPRTKRRLVELLRGSSTAVPSEALRAWSLDFLLSPISFDPDREKTDCISSVTFAKTQLEGPDIFKHSASVRLVDEQVKLPASLAFRSIGYKSEALVGMEDLGINFNSDRGVISNDYCGRVVMPGSDSKPTLPIPGMYCSGWVKQGPTGVIANTMEDAFATAEVIAKDWQDGAPFMAGGQGWLALRAEVKSKGLRTVSWGDWLKIDAAERERGKANGKKREKFTSIEQMLNVLN